LAWLILALFSKELVHLIAQNKDYYEAWKIVPIIAMISVMNGGKDFFGKGMVMASKSRHIAGIFLIAAAANVILNLLFIPVWNVYGAAAATLISFFLLSGLNIYYSNKFYHLKFNFGLLGRVALVAFIIYGISFFVTPLQMFYSIPLKLVLVLIFPLVIYYGGVFSHKEKMYAHEFVSNIKKGCLPFSSR
jgi:O-antigen/teichoic acid export membrane protein